jgi:soluble lytic murein transglycosylase-like protein
LSKQSPGLGRAFTKQGAPSTMRTPRRKITIKLAIVALGLWTGGAAWLTEYMRPGPPAQDIETVISRAADLYHIDRELLAAVAWQESHKGQIKADSPAGAVGVMQLMPAVIADAGGIDARNHIANIMVGAELLAKHIVKYKGNTGLALAAYNWGPANVNRWLKNGAQLSQMPAETRAYIKAITNVPIEYWRKA